MSRSGHLSLLPLLAALLVGCASAPQKPPPVAEAPPFARDPRAVLEADVARVLGAALWSEVLVAREAVLVRRPTSFPRMIQQPDGSWLAEPPMMAAAVRGSGGWTRITREGRAPLPTVVGAELDRLIADEALQTESDTLPGTCTDPSGILVLARSAGRERVSTHPCGFAGVAGQLGNIVLTGEITDWASVPAAQRPAGVPLRRFDEAIALSYRYASGIYEERRLDIRSAAEWEAQWRRLTARQGPQRPPPPVDFRREMVLVAAMGPRPTGGYSVVIDRAIETRSGLEVHVRHIAPGRRCGVTAALTQPADVVVAPATPNPVRWVVETAVSECD